MNCTLDSTVSYTVFIEDNSGEVVHYFMDQHNVSSGSCVAGRCSFTFPSSDRNCRVGVKASNVFGESEVSQFATIGNLISLNKDFICMQFFYDYRICSTNSSKPNLTDIGSSTISIGFCLLDNSRYCDREEGQ